MNSESRSLRPKRRMALVRLPCACANLRRTARLVSQLYDEALRHAGIRGPQFTLLQVLKMAPGLSQKKLAKLLGTDSTTLTRTLALLRKRGWVSTEAGADRRAVRLGLTKSGEKAYERALPSWQLAQKRLKEAVGEPQLAKMVDSVMYVAEALQ